MTRQGYNHHTDGGHGSFFCIVSLSVAAVLFVCALLAMRGCGGRGRGDGGQADTTYKYIYVHDTVRKSVTVEKPRPVAEFVPVLDTIVIRDTVEILRDYFAERLYRYDYADTDIRFTSDIVVCENELRTVSTDYELFRESLTIEKTVTRQPVFRLGVGGGFSTHFGKGWDIELNTSLGIRRHRLTLGYGIRDNRLTVGYQFDIISR